MSDDSSLAPVTWTIDDGVAVIRYDDGKANVVSHQAIELLTQALDDAEARAQAVCLVGRDGKLSAGFDLGVMTSGPEASAALVHAGGQLLLRLYGHPQPTVVAVTGHALAMGALLVLACDTRIGSEGPYKIGLNEVAIGLRLPIFAVELARDRLSKRAFTRATMQAEVLDPRGAVDAGFLDRVVDPAECVDEALAEARRLSQLRSGAYGTTKRLARRATLERIGASFAEDLESLGIPG